MANGTFHCILCFFVWNLHSLLRLSIFFFLFLLIIMIIAFFVFLVPCCLRHLSFLLKIYFVFSFLGLFPVGRQQNDENTFGFETPSKSACKSLYKCCSQHLAFFRLVQMSGPLLTSTASAASSSANQNNSLNSIGSKFLKLSGAAAPTSTALNGQQESQDSDSPPQFRRMPSRRHQRRIVDGASHRKFPLFVFLFSFLTF